MRIGTLGKRRFAYGLTWTDVVDDKPIAVAREAAIAERDKTGEGGKKPPSIVYAVTVSDQGERTVGFQRLSEAPQAKKGKLYSYAAAVAATGNDGVYVAPIDDENVWYVAVSGGMVIASTDVERDRATGVSQVRNLAVAMDLPIYVAHGFDLGIPDADTFDSEQIVEGVKIRPLSRDGADSPVAVAVAALVFLGVVGAGWHFTRPEVPMVFDNTAELEAQRKQNYLMAARSELGSAPGAGDWLIASHDSARQLFPSVIAGWTLNNVSCEPGRCSAQYEAGGSPIAFLAVMHERFGPGAVGEPDPGGRTVVVTQALPTPAGVDYTDEQIMQPHVWPAHPFDTLNLLGLRFPGVVVDGAYRDESMGEQLGAPADAAPLHRVRVAVKQLGAPDSAVLKSVVSHFGSDGYTPLALQFSTGAGNAPATWRIEFSRVGGRP